MKKRLSIFLTTVALIAGMVGCASAQYNLTISTTEGGEVTSPGEVTFTYDEGTVVDLVAEAEEGYRFVEWTGDVDDIADVNAASTTITMNDNYSITANFVAQYVLTIDSTDGGGVITPGEGTFTYDAGTVVDLVAEAEEGYKFLNWTGDVETVANVTAALTTIVMNDNYAITADFIQAHTYLDKIGPGLWGLGVWGQGVNATVTEEGVVVSITSDPVDDPQVERQPAFGGGGQSTYLLRGDFDIRMDYELITWPQESGVRVGMSVGVPDIPDMSMYDMSINIERVSWGAPEYPQISFREVYLVNACFEHSIVGITSTDDLAGTLRIRREGVIISCYHRTSDGWHKLYEKEWSTENVYVWVSTWSHEYLFGGEEVNVLMRTVEIVEPTP